MSAPYYSEDHSMRLDAALDGFETALADRYQLSVHDAVKNQLPLPTRLSTDANEVLWNHLTPEVAAHVDESRNYFGGCDYLKWYENGRQGKVQDVTCNAKIGEASIHDDSAARAPLETLDHCGVGDLLAAAEQWAWADRKLIADKAPAFAVQNLVALEEARNALVEMASDFLGPATAVGFPAGLNLNDTVTKLAPNPDHKLLEAWTGLAADAAANGFFASTQPTLFAHGVIANRLGELINERASIIHYYRENTLTLVLTATDALGAKSTATVDVVPVWKVVQGFGMSLSIVPQTAPAGAVISLVGWLGEQFVPESRSIEFTSEPGVIAGELFNQISVMKQTLADAEMTYLANVTEFRNALDAVPSTFLELYDFRENDG
jgi:hypothetical protein